GLADVVKNDESILSGYLFHGPFGKIVIVGGPILDRVEGIRSGRFHFPYPRGCLQALGSDQFQSPVQPYGIPDLEGSMFPTKTGLHGVIDSIEFVRNLRDPVA